MTTASQRGLRRETICLDESFVDGHGQELRLEGPLKGVFGITGVSCPQCEIGFFDLTMVSNQYGVSPPGIAPPQSNIIGRRYGFICSNPNCSATFIIEREGES